MAQLIERGILEGVHTIVEAGTGVGKSLAYLVPAVRSGKKIVLSTGTIALQPLSVQAEIRTHAGGPAHSALALAAGDLGMGRFDADWRPR